MRTNDNSQSSFPGPTADLANYGSKPDADDRVTST